ncbi:RNA polymerase sigma factor [Pedobacter sp. AW31-3R]|uniref:RNA polymerase sigma factor n=1 Tax=Pedobacter sp. AW31-3R TaxID=3445781 RepID=UPI003FA15666
MQKSNYPSKSDEELLALLKSGDKLAFDTIYSRYWKKLYAESYKRLKNHQQIQEMVQDIFSDLWVKKETKDILNLERYLYMCTKYQVFAVYRKEKNNPQFEEPLETMAYYTINADSVLNEKELKKYVSIWLLTQPEKRREIFRLKHIEDLSTSEIAAHLKISQKTVQNQLITSHNNLKVFLKKINYLLSLLALLIR